MRDNVRLAQAYKGLQTVPTPETAAEQIALTLGARESFKILDVVHNTIDDIEAELMGMGEHAYFWFDTGPGAKPPDPAALDVAVETFDAIYAQTIDIFGPEANPGIDGDARLHIVHASPIALCGVTEDSLDNCATIGLVNSTDLLPVEVDGRSNEREMFVMNQQVFGGDYYLSVLAHEFRHMIEDNYDPADWDWEKEGSATLAAQLSGFPSGGPQRGNQFLQNPDQQLNSWSQENRAAHYGQGYLLNRYLYDRFGASFYRAFAVSPATGLNAIDAVAVEQGLDISGVQVWLDWLAALAVHPNPKTPDRFQFENSGVNTAAAVSIDDLPVHFDTTVNQFAADYYLLPEQPATLIFEGAPQASLLGAEPASGAYFWYAQRANGSNPRLTRALDLRDVTAATLQYQVYADIEQGYDFAYVAVSTDNGRSWQPLVAENMQGLDPAHNPSGGALAPRFYSGQNPQWVQESIDLGSYAGQEILLRFEYVTDPILTYGGFALDDVAVPEIGFFDGAEDEQPGWLAEGFLRATEALPQSWHLQLITYEGDVPQVTQHMLNGAEGLTLTVAGSAKGGNGRC